MNKYLIINGPNLNMLGIREPDIYGKQTYDDLCDFIAENAKKMNIHTDFFQSNSEGEIVTQIQKTHNSYDGLVINPGAYAHYSYAIHDAIKGISIPTVEVHISNVHTREDFRRVSVTAPACIGQMCGFGEFGYVLGIEALENYIINN